MRAAKAPWGRELWVQRGRSRGIHVERPPGERQVLDFDQAAGVAPGRQRRGRLALGDDPGQGGLEGEALDRFAERAGHALGQGDAAHLAGQQQGPVAAAFEGRAFEGRRTPGELITQGLGAEAAAAFFGQRHTFHLDRRGLQPATPAQVDQAPGGRGGQRDLAPPAAPRGAQGLLERHIEAQGQRFPKRGLAGDRGAGPAPALGRRDPGLGKADREAERETAQLRTPVGDHIAARALFLGPEGDGGLDLIGGPEPIARKPAEGEQGEAEPRAGQAGQEHVADRRTEVVSVIAAIIGLRNGPVPRLPRRFEIWPATPAVPHFVFSPVGERTPRKKVRIDRVC